jgi:curli biogenesis system outer membrane secretion channel CsgG
MDGGQARAALVAPSKEEIMKKLMCAVLLATFLLPAIAMAAGDRPRIAVLQFENKAEHSWWHSRGGAAAQDVFVTELVKSGKFRVIDRERLDALMREKNLSASGDIDPSTATRMGKLLGVQYFLTGAVTEYGSTTAGARAPSIGGLPSFSMKRKKFSAAMNARIIDAETGEILWADESRKVEKASKVFVGGVGGGVDNDALFDKVLKPVIQELVASIKAADL